jgi:phosphatidylserine/phosphatidylglycerophosphate/cardiolipin synthase-like enzyme
MAIVSFTDKKKIKKFLTPLATSEGYVLDFSNSTFQDFISSVAGIDIYEEGKYNNEGNSKAKRLWSFLDKESDYIVGIVLLELVEYQKTLASEYHSVEIQPDEILEIANQLIKGSVVEEHNSAGTVHFKEIRAQILSKLKEAEFTIWVAVAWFTDSVLFECLITKRNQGLNVQLIIYDDNINNSSGLDYDQFETYKLPPWGHRGMNKMHNKFCIIDFKHVIHGSYNWTNAARHNRETIDISTGYNKAEAFNQEFMELKLQGMKLKLKEINQ